MPPNLTGLLDQLGCPRSPDLFSHAVNMLGGSFDILANIRQNATASIDVSDLVGDEVRPWLSGLYPSVNFPVLVAWVADRIAAKMPFSTFVDRFDDLWYPSLDDVIVIWSDGGVLLIEHSERLFFAHIDFSHEPGCDYNVPP